VVSKRVSKKINNRNQIVLGYFVLGSGILSLAYADNLLLVLILIGVLATGGAFIIPNITSEISLNGGSTSGSALGIQKSTDGLGQTIGPILGSWLLNINSSLPYFLTGASVILISLILVLVNQRGMFVVTPKIKTKR
jgi:predicted MFS family arabinose efflux permease